MVCLLPDESNPYLKQKTKKQTSNLKGIKTSSLKFLKMLSYLFFTICNSLSFSHPFLPVLGMTSDDNVTAVISEPDLSKCGVNYCPAVPVDNSG